MSLKKSIYTIFVDTTPDGKKLVYNSLTSAYAIMDERTEKIYNEIDNINILTNESLSENDKVNISTMQNLGFIVDKKLDEFKSVILDENITRFSNRCLSLTIAPTMDCNMACPYCYEKNKKTTMCIEVRDKIVNFVDKYITKNAILSLSVVWYGGEPLLELDTIKHMSEKLIEICKKNHIEYSASIVTNGVLLDRDTANVLVSGCKINSVQITVDGINQIHSKRRMLKDGRNSFDLIMNNIETIKNILNITIRINVDKENLSNISDLINFFIREKRWYKNPSFYLAPIEKNTESCMIDNSICIMGNDFATINAACLRIIYENCDREVASSFYPWRQYIDCGATRLNNFVIDPQGFFYACWIDIGLTKKAIGYIDDAIYGIQNQYHIKNVEHIKWLTIEQPDKCKTCNYYPLCHGGCPSVRINNNEPSCNHKIYSLHENLKLVYEHYQNNVK